MREDEQNPSMKCNKHIKIVYYVRGNDLCFGAGRLAGPDDGP